MRTGFTLAAVAFGVLSLVAACNSNPSERVGKVSSSLLAQGQACTVAGECVTGFCVDAVCCNTACGGSMVDPCGVRDEFSCSNIYGNVNGLTDGTCFTLSNGEACGELVSCNSCQARGATLTNGNNCPNPQLFNRNGLECRGSTAMCDPNEICTNGA
jgi:hypothetical protein